MVIVTHLSWNRTRKSRSSASCSGGSTSRRHSWASILLCPLCWCPVCVWSPPCCLASLRLFWNSAGCPLPSIRNSSRTFKQHYLLSGWMAGQCRLKWRAAKTSLCSLLRTCSTSSHAWLEPKALYRTSSGQSEVASRCTFEWQRPQNGFCCRFIIILPSKLNGQDYYLSRLIEFTSKHYECKSPSPDPSRTRPLVSWATLKCWRAWRLFLCWNRWVLSAKHFDHHTSHQS